MSQKIEIQNRQKKIHLEGIGREIPITPINDVLNSEMWNIINSIQKCYSKTRVQWPGTLILCLGLLKSTQVGIGKVWSSASIGDSHKADPVSFIIQKITTTNCQMISRFIKRSQKDFKWSVIFQKLCEPNKIISARWLPSVDCQSVIPAQMQVSWFLKVYLMILWLDM